MRGSPSPSLLLVVVVVPPCVPPLVVVWQVTMGGQGPHAAGLGVGLAKSVVFIAAVAVESIRACSASQSWGK